MIEKGHGLCYNCIMVTSKKPDSEIRRLDADDLYLEQVRAARLQSLEEKLFAGIELFELACEFIRAGIRVQHPNFNDDEVEDALRQRLELGRRLEAGS